MSHPLSRRLTPPALAVQKSASGDFVLVPLGAESVAQRLAAIRLKAGEPIYVVRADDMRALVELATSKASAAVQFGAN